jgi:hypothetical protein
VKTFIALSLVLFSFTTAYADGGSIIPGTCPFKQNDLSELDYALTGRLALGLAADSELEENIYDSSGFEVSVFANSDFHFSSASRAHILRRHWNGVRHAGESIPSVFNHGIFPGFFVVESLIYETINNAVALNTPPCSTRNVRGNTYAAYTLGLTGGTIVKVVINVAAHVIVTAYPLN